MKKLSAVCVNMRWFLRSRYFFAAFCILLEFVQIMAVLYKYFFPITIAGRVFYAGVLLYLINREETPEFKLPWMVLLLIVPVIGAFAFVVLSSTEKSKDRQKKHREAEDRLVPWLKRRDALPQLTADGDARAQAEYICRVSRMPCCRNTEVTYYETGQAFHQALLESLKQARRFIFMEYFIIAPGAMWDPVCEILKRKASEGVEVFLMYDDLGCMGLLPEKYDRTMQEQGIRCIASNRFTPILSNVHNNRDHRKITVVDGTVGFTGGINLADEYINAVERFGHWKDTAVRLEGEAVGSLSALFISFWNSQCSHTLDYGLYMEVQERKETAQGMVLPYGDGPKLLYPESIGKNVYLNMIHGARKYLYLTTPYLICDRELLNSLELAAKKGVDVRILVPHIPDKKIVFLLTRSNYSSLIRAGVKICEYTPGFVHGKNFICDDKFAVCGTINMDYRSLVHHYECGVWMYDTDCIPQMKDDFLRSVSRSEEMSEKKAGLNVWQRLPAEILKLFAPLF